MTPLKSALCLCLLVVSPFLTRAQEVTSSEFSATFSDGWLVSWTNKRTGEVFDFGRPSDPSSVPVNYRPGSWPIPGYQQDGKTAAWTLQATPGAGQPDGLVLTQSIDVTDGLAQTVQWSLRLPLDKIEGSYWPTGLTNRMLAKDVQTPEGAIGKNYYFKNRAAVLSSHQWRHRYFVIQGKKGGLAIYVDDPELDHFSAIEMDASKFPSEVILTQRSLASPPWTSRYQSAKWRIVQYDGWVNNGAEVVRTHLATAYDLKPLSERPTAWVQDLAYAFVKGPFTDPATRFPGTINPNYTENWKESLALVDQWLDNLSQVVEPAKVMIYVNWWRYAAHDTMFPEHSIDPFFAHAVGHIRKRGFHVMLHFHNHLAQDGASAFFGRYIAKQDEWHRAAYPNRPHAIGDPEGKIMWGVGYDFVRRTEVVQRDKDFGTTYSKRQGLPTRMTGYHMSPAYEGWRYMKVAEILSALRATGADALHIDVPAVWPEGKERYGINSQQGSREFFKLLRETLDSNGLEHVAIATEATPGEGYMRYVDMAQLVRGSSITSMLDGISVDTMIELQLGDDLDKANAIRAAATARYPTEAGKKIKEELRFDAKAVGERLAKIRELGEPNIDAMVSAPYVRAYPHLGSASALMGGYPGDPAVAVHNQAALALHTWATLHRGAPFNSTPQLLTFMDAAPWNEAPEVAAIRKEVAASGKRTDGKILNAFNYGEFALARWWQQNQPRFAPLPEWQKGDVARYRLADGRSFTVRRNEKNPLVLNLAVDGRILADIDIFGGWENADTLLTDHGPEFLRNQIDGGVK